jgi:hypothetical protein
MQQEDGGEEKEAPTAAKQTKNQGQKQAVLRGLVSKREERC